MRKPQNRQSASTLLAMAHKAYEANKWNVRDLDTVTVIMSPQVGVHKAIVMSRRTAIKQAAKQRKLRRYDRILSCDMVKCIKARWAGTWQDAQYFHNS